jgi:hypothetical protein
MAGFVLTLAVPLDGRDLICDRLVDEVGWIRQCAGWLTHLRTSEYPPAVDLRPDGDHPDKAHVMVDLPRGGRDLAADRRRRRRVGPRPPRGRPQHGGCPA